MDRGARFYPCMTKVCSVALFGVLLAGPAARGRDPARVDAEAVAAAVQRGVRWLRREQKPNGELGTGSGETALALLALRHSGTPATDPACQKAAQRLERVLPDGTVYGAALGVLALLAQNPEAHQPKIRRLVGQLASGQCRNGQWTYSYRATAKKKAGDNSNTQIAILAMGAARARRIEVPKEVFSRCEDFFVKSQNEDGGFGYSAKQRKASYASMTAGGAMALRICAAARKGVDVRDPVLDDLPQVSRALTWLETRFDPANNSGSAAAFGSKRGKRSDSFWRYYWLWSLERACEVCGKKKLGERDWYAEGVAFLLDHQQKRGEWRGPERSIQGTCFALLFFARKTAAAVTPRDRDRPRTTPGD